MNYRETCVPSSELKTNGFSETLKVVRIYARQGITSSVISEELHGAWRLDAVMSDAFAPQCSVQGAEPHLQSCLIFILRGSESIHSCTRQGNANERHIQWEKVWLLGL